MNYAGLHAIVKGNVQGVGYRWFAARSAQRINLTGWAKNLPSGEVEVKAFGDKGALNSLIKQLSVGPSFSKVNDVVVRWIEYEPSHTEFNIKN